MNKINEFLHHQIISNMNAQQLTTILNWGCKLSFILVFYIIFSQLLTQYASRIFKYDFADVSEVGEAIFILYFKQLSIMGCVIYWSYLLAVLGPHCTQQISTTVHKWNVLLEVLEAWDIKPQESELNPMWALHTEFNGHVFDIHSNNNEKEGYMMTRDKIVYQRLNFHETFLGLKNKLPHSVKIDPTKTFTLMAAEFDQLLTNMELLQFLKNKYPEFCKYFLCPINSHDWGIAGSPDAVLFDSINKNYGTIQFKSLTGNLHNKLNVEQEFGKYQKFIDVLDITVTDQPGFEQFFINMKKFPWMFEVWLQIQAHEMGMDPDVLLQSIESHYDYLYSKNYTVFSQINQTCKKESQYIIKGEDLLCIQRKPNSIILDAIKELKEIKSKKIVQQFYTINKYEQ